jgi:NAD(P)-dependent dehydrogenase (short-subunit alcohol dehydrogenase family)
MGQGASKVVVTGVSRGLGRALAEKFAALGHTVLGCGRSEQAGDELRRRLGPPHDFAAVDVADAAQVAAWAARLLAAHGPPDLLVNNAALLNRPAPLWQVPAAEFDQLIDVNVKGVANVLRYFLPAMVAKNHGVVVNFSSGLGRSGAGEVAPYCASKFAVEGLTQALSQEMTRGMAAVALNPGVIDTDMLRLWGASGGYPSPAEWAERAVPFLLQLGRKDNGRPLSVPG